MISLILPYWDRQEAADKALKLLAETYHSKEFEVIVVDDGNKWPFIVPNVPLAITVVRLPDKKYPTPQSKAWNAGVKAAEGDIVILSCIEVLHEKPVIHELVNNLRQIGHKGYVLASAWCPEENKWHCHTSESIPTVPEGTGPAFCAAIYKSFYNEIGGFDEIYHFGAGYEDKDFIWKLKTAGAQFVIRDDLVVIHPKAGAKIQWKQEGFARNEMIYRDKWFQPITFVCLKAGDAYGPEYVNILRDMVARNLSDGYPGRFVCITDNPEGLDEGIEVIPLPDDLETWWGKIYMFKHGVFKNGERCIFMDLDTVIIGNLDEIVRYRGKFATLKDFYYPERLGPAIIAWEAGEWVEFIWNQWVAQGKPRNHMGDLWWLNSLAKGRFRYVVDILQDLYPNQFCSYKADCNPLPPSGTRVVCFHGQPKPSNCAEPWVADAWRIGGSGMAVLDVVANTNRETVKANILSACARDILWLKQSFSDLGHAVIVAGGPSLNETLPEIKYRIGLGQKVIAVNGVAKFLNGNGIIPDIHVVIDARPENLAFITESTSKEYYLASQCHPSLFDAVKNVTVFHMNTEGIEEIIPKDREACLISSGTTVGLAAMVVAYCLGYRAIHLHGFDSSYTDQHHAYSQPLNDADQVVDVVVNGERFKAAPWMVKQAQQFQELAVQLANDDVVITVAGHGLLPYIAKCLGE